MMKTRFKFFRDTVANVVIVLLLVTLTIISYAGGVLNVFSSSNSDPIYHGNLSKKNVTLSFNVYWGTEFIEPILKVLKENNIKTTFFIGGIWAAQNNELLLKIRDDGHELGNHGYFHKDHQKLSFESEQEEIYSTHKLIKTITGIDMQLFAPPSGAFSNSTLQIAKNLGYKTIMWTKDTIDWRDKDSNLIYTRATKNAMGGDFILMHPTSATLVALPNIIKFYFDNGFKLTTISENLV